MATITTNITVTVSAVGAGGIGARIPLVLTTTSAIAVPTLFSSLSAMIDAGFTTTDAGYLDVAAIFAQVNRPAAVLVAPRQTPVAQVLTLRVNGADDGDYTVVVNGKTFTHNASSETATQIRDALIIGIDGLVHDFDQTDVDAAAVATTDMTLTALTAGVPFTVTVSNANGNLVFVQNVDVTGNDAGNYIVQIGTAAANQSLVVGDGIITATAIRNALRTDINTKTVNHGVTAADGAGDDIDLTSTVPFVVTVSAPSSNLTLTGRTLSVGYPEDLTAVQNVNTSWTILLAPDATTAPLQRSIADAIESFDFAKLAFLQTTDTNVIDTALDVITPIDIGSRLRSLSYQRSVLVYEAGTTRTAAAWVGRRIADEPGEVTWAHTSLVGVPVENLTANQIANAKARGVNWYANEGGGVMLFGATSATSIYIDLVRGADAIQQALEVAIINYLNQVPKTGFSQRGIDQITGVFQRTLEQFTTGDTPVIAAQRILQDGTTVTPGYEITAEPIGNYTDAERASRTMNRFTWVAQLEGAVHEVASTGTLVV